ncbi:MAG: AtpZ/AtpI family protein [Planctomycetota bacterium]
MDWSGRIISIALMMILPGVAGHWLDDRNGTGYWMPIGMVVGIAISIWQLVTLTRMLSSQLKQSDSGKSAHGQRPTQRPRA